MKIESGSINNGTSISATASETMNELVTVCSDFVDITAIITKRLPSKVITDTNERNTNTVKFIKNLSKNLS